MLIKSKKFPRIDHETISNAIIEIGKYEDNPVTRTFMEVAFISTTNSHDQKGLKLGSLNRAAFLEIILRVILESYKKREKKDQTIVDHFEKGFSIYCKP